MHTIATPESLLGDLMSEKFLGGNTVVIVEESSTMPGFAHSFTSRQIRGPGLKSVKSVLTGESFPVKVRQYSDNVRVYTHLQ
jgi:hypothetical protein